MRRLLTVLSIAALALGIAPALGQTFSLEDYMNAKEAYLANPSEDTLAAFNRARAELAGVVTPGAPITRAAVAEVEPNNSAAMAQALLESSFTLDFDPDIGDQTTNTSTTIPHASISGTGDGTFDVFSFNIGAAGDMAIFDIDYGTQGGFIDSWLNLYDTDGLSLLAQNDDWPTSAGQGGSTSGLDSYLEYTFPAPGLYYIEVGTCCIGPVPAGGDYVLQVSKPAAAIPTLGEWAALGLLLLILGAGAVVLRRRSAAG